MKQWIWGLCLTVWPLCTPLNAHVVVVDGGKVHLQGSLVNGACTVTPESQTLEVLMGQYRSNYFTDPGTYAPVSIPFSLHLTGCTSAVASQVAIGFSGITAAGDPQVLQATVRTPAGDKPSGIGLALFDSQQQLIVPNTRPTTFIPINQPELVVNFTARYRAVSPPYTPGSLATEAWFTLIYP